MIRRYADLAVLVALPVGIWFLTGCQLFTELTASAAETMPDPTEIGEPGGITATQFWLTWLGTMAAHELRKRVRGWMGRDDPPVNRNNP